MTSRRQKRLNHRNIRINDAERAALDALSETLGVNHSEVLRRGIHALAETITEPKSVGGKSETTK